MTQLVTKYHNDLNGLSFGSFSAVELDLFFTIISNIKNKGVLEVTYEFNKLRSLSDYKHRGKERFLKDLERTYKKMLSIIWTVRDNGVTDYFVLFTRFTIDENQQTVTIKVNEEYQYILNDLTASFTRFELKEFTQLKSVYSKTLYRILKQFRMTGFYKVEIKKFRDLLDVPKSYTISDIDSRVLNQSMKELNDYFGDLRVKKIRGNTRGRPITHLEFRFLKEKNFQVIRDDKWKEKSREEYYKKYPSMREKDDTPKGQLILGQRKVY